MKLAAGC